MQNFQHQTTDKIEKQCLPITTSSIFMAMLNGIISVVTAYFFKPIWEKLIRWWNK